MQKTLINEQTDKFKKIKFYDGTSLSSGSSTDYDFHVKKKLKVDSESNFLSDILINGKITTNSLSVKKDLEITGDLTITKNLHVNGYMYGQFESVETTSKNYTDLRTGWPWITDSNHVYNVLTDSLWAHINVIENSYATSTDVSDATKNTLSFIRNAEATYPIFADPTTSYTDPVTYLANNNLLIIRQDEITTQKLKIQIKNNTSVGKFLKCISDDGDVGWGDPNINIVEGDQLITTTYGEGHQASLFIKDTNQNIIHDIQFFLNCDTTTKAWNKLIDNGNLFCMYGRSSSGWSANSQPASVIGAYSTGSEAIKFQAGYINGTYINGYTLIGGGKQYYTNQEILLHQTGIHIASNDSIVNWGKLEIKSRITTTGLYQQPPNIVTPNGSDNQAQLIVGEQTNTSTLGIVKIYGSFLFNNSTSTITIPLNKQLFLKCYDVTGVAIWDTLPLSYSLTALETYRIDGAFNIGNTSYTSTINASQLNINAPVIISGSLQSTSFSSNSLTVSQATSLQGQITLFAPPAAGDYYLGNNGTSGLLQWKKFGTAPQGESVEIKAPVEFYNIMNFWNAGLVSAGVGAGIGYAIGDSTSGDYNGVIKSSFRNNMLNQNTCYYWKFINNTNSNSPFYPLKILYNNVISNTISIGSSYPPVSDKGIFDNSLSSSSSSINAIDFYKDNKIYTDTETYNNTLIPISSPAELRIAGKIYYRYFDSGSSSYATPYINDVLVGTGNFYTPNHTYEKYGETKWTNIANIIPTNYLNALKINNNVYIGNLSQYSYTQSGSTITVPVTKSDLSINGKIFFKYAETNIVGVAYQNYVLTCVDSSTGEVQWKAPNDTLSQLNVSGTSIFNGACYHRSTTTLYNDLILQYPDNSTKTISLIELGYLDGCTSNLQTQINNITSGGGGSYLPLSGGTVTGQLKLQSGLVFKGGSSNPTLNLNFIDQLEVNNSNTPYNKFKASDFYSEIRFPGTNSYDVRIQQNIINGDIASFYNLFKYTRIYYNSQSLSGTSNPILLLSEDYTSRQILMMPSTPPLNYNSIVQQNDSVICSHNNNLGQTVDKSSLVLCSHSSDYNGIRISSDVINSTPVHTTSIQTGSCSISLESQKGISLTNVYKVRYIDNTNTFNSPVISVNSLTQGFRNITPDGNVFILRGNYIISWNVMFLTTASGGIYTVQAGVSNYPTNFSINNGYSTQNFMGMTVPASQYFSIGGSYHVTGNETTGLTYYLVVRVFTSILSIDGNLSSFQITRCS